MQEANRAPRGKAGREEGKARVKKAEEGEFGGASRVETLRLSTWERSLGLSVRLLSVAFEGQGLWAVETEVSQGPARCLSGKDAE